jgi:tetratricopeptide (TPR) repeat protein
VSKRYTIGSLERLATAGDRMTRRAAVLALGLLADFSSNATLGRGLHDADRGVRMLADHWIRVVWQRDGSQEQRARLQRVLEANTNRFYFEAIEEAARLLEDAPFLAEAWNQRALALFSTGRYADSIADCTEALEINPYHFQAAAGMAQCHLQLHDHARALDCFRRALALNPNLEGVRAHVLYLQRTLKRHE